MRYDHFTMLPERAFQKKLTGIFGSAPATLESGGGGGGIMAAVAVIATVAAAVMTDGASLAVEGAVDTGVAATEGAIATDAVTTGAEAVSVAANTADAGLSADAIVATSESAQAASDLAIANETANTAIAATQAGEDMAMGQAAADAASMTGNAALDSALQSAGTGALTSAGMNAAGQLVQTGSIDPNKVLKAGATGAVMGGAGSGLSSMGVNPLLANTLAGSAAGGVGAALNGGDVGKGLLVGGAGGAASGVANMAGQAMGLNPTLQGALSGAVRGGTMSAVNNGSIGTGALTGAVVGGASSAANQLGTGIQNAATDSTGNNSLLGQVLGGAAGTEAKSLFAPSTSTAAHMVGAPSALPKMSPAGTPIASQPSTATTAGGNTGMPTFASSHNNVSEVALPGGGAGVPVASTPNANTGSASNLFPTSGLNASGLPAQLTPGVLTSSAVPASQDNTDQVNQLKQLYPQLANVDPRILDSLVSSPVTMKEGGMVRMASGGSPQYEAVQQLLGIPQVKESAAEQAAYGNPTGGYRRPLVATHFINGRKDGGGIHSLEYGAHVPEFVTGKTGHYVKGKGDGQSDDIPAMLADGEYVFDADTVASLGNGSSDAGSKVLDKMREEIRKHKRSASAKEIPPKAKSPLEYMKGKA